MKNHWNDKKTRHGGPMPYQILGSSVSALFEYKIFRLFFFVCTISLQKGLSHECIYPFKRFPLQSNANKKHKNYLGTLASQNNFVHSVFATLTTRPFKQVNT